MAWFKVDDDLAFHAKVVQAGNAAMGLWVRAGAYCGQHLTDGFVAREVALAMGRKAEINRLVDVGLWEPAEVDGKPGWRFHEFLDRNPSRDEVEQKRREEADRKAAWRARRAAQRAGQDRDGDGTDDDVPSGHPPDETRDTHVSPTGVPDLSRSSRPEPDPVSPNGDTPSLRSGAAQKRGTRLPDDFAVTDEMRAWARGRGFTDPQIDEITEQFTRYWRAKSGRDATKRDWPATWQNWVAKEAPERVRVAPRLAASNGRRTWTAEELTAVLGPDMWRCPQPPRDLTPDEMWEWERRVKREHWADRIAAAEAKLAGVS